MNTPMPLASNAVTCSCSLRGLDFYFPSFIPVLFSYVCILSCPTLRRMPNDRSIHRSVLPLIHKSATWSATCSYFLPSLYIFTCLYRVQCDTMRCDGTAVANVPAFLCTSTCVHVYIIRYTYPFGLLFHVYIIKRNVFARLLHSGC